MLEDIDRVLYDEDALQTRVRQIGTQITLDYQSEPPLFVGILKGMAFFLADLMRATELPLAIDTMAISSYGPATRQTGVVKILKDLEESVEGRHILVIEDIINTGLTLGYILRNLRSRKPASLRICTLLDKPKMRLIDLPIAYRGFSAPSEFVVGYGLDYRERYRNLPFIGVLKSEVLK